MTWRFNPFTKAPEAVNKVESLKAFLALDAFAMASFSVFYGLLTYIFGEDLWPPEQSAYTIPRAPESFGTLLIIAGVFTIVASSKRLMWSKYVSWGMRALCFLYGVFAVTYIIDLINGAGPEVYSRAGAYLVFSILCASRASLEDQWRA